MFGKTKKLEKRISVLSEEIFALREKISRQEAKIRTMGADLEHHEAVANAFMQEAGYTYSYEDPVPGRIVVKKGACL